eukprot:6190117-Pleurochrysis_carterae.AAC.1
MRLQRLCGASQHVPRGYLRVSGVPPRNTIQRRSVPERGMAAQGRPSAQHTRPYALCHDHECDACRSK